MNMKLACVAGAMVVTGPAFGITVNFTDFTFGSPAIGVAVSGNQSYNGEAGEFKGFLGGSPNSVVVLDEANLNIPAPYSTGGTSFTAYCAELTQGFSFGVDYSYGQVTGLAYFGAQKAADLSRLFTGAAGFVTSKSASGAFQAAIWEIIYEPGSSYDLTSGAFKAAAVNLLDVPSFTFINSVLTNLGSYGANYRIDVLTNPRNQDFLVGTIPEPGTWALLVAGLGVIGVVSRRRKP